MKTKIDYQIFADKLKELCEKHNIGIIGTCSSESIYGEITLIDLEQPESCGWIDAKNKINYIVNNDFTL